MRFVNNKLEYARILHFFPLYRDCAFMGIGFSMPTCSNGQSDSPDHKSHMAYTTDGSVAGPW